MSLPRTLFVTVLVFAFGIQSKVFCQLPTPTYGWNLGNTLEPPAGVGAWGPAPTQALINSVAAAGFNTVRIPCAWDSHANQSTYQIDPNYMATVKQVVDWCYAKNLYVIINDHWDGGWLENNITDAVNPTINSKMSSYWTQIATAFKDYDGNLLFAAANEPNATTSAQVATLMAYYQTFVTAVRSTGGNNTSRWLVIQGPQTNIDKTFQLLNTLPNDPTSGRMAVEVHFYDPYQYTLMTADASWGKMFYFWGQGYHSSSLTDRNSTWGEEDWIESEFQSMYTKFVSHGVPVILGEFAAVKRTGYTDLTGYDLALHLASRTYFDKTVVDKANSKGIKPMYWDAGGTGQNSSQLFDRSTAAVIDADSARALTGGAALPPPTGNSHLVNISTRSLAGSGSSTLIAGFIIQGNSPRKVLIRAGGPYLTQFSVTSVLDDPVLTLFSGQDQIAQNDDWGADAVNIAAATVKVGATGFPVGSKDAAIVSVLQPGIAYTAQVSGKNSQTGNAIVEVYDADDETDSKLVNISTRSYVGTGGSIQIGGFILRGSGPQKVLIRAGGPYLSQFNVQSVLADPVLTIYAGQNQIAQNDDWGTNATSVNAATTQAGILSYANGSADSAVVLQLNPGVAYTAQVSGKNNATGNALIEIFQL